ncbi:unnamed protein product, partial [Nesidiocoris tenuis]
FDAGESIRPRKVSVPREKGVKYRSRKRPAVVALSGSVRSRGQRRGRRGRHRLAAPRTMDPGQRNPTHLRHRRLNGHSLGARTRCPNSRATGCLRNSNIAKSTRYVQTWTRSNWSARRKISPSPIVSRFKVTSRDRIFTSKFTDIAGTARSASPRRRARRRALPPHAESYAEINTPTRAAPPPDHLLVGGGARMSSTENIGRIPRSQPSTPTAGRGRVGGEHEKASRPLFMGSCPRGNFKRSRHQEYCSLARPPRPRTLVDYCVLTTMSSSKCVTRTRRHKRMKLCTLRHMHSAQGEILHESYDVLIEFNNQYETSSDLLKPIEPAGLLSKIIHGDQRRLTPSREYRRWCSKLII